MDQMFTFYDNVMYGPNVYFLCNVWTKCNVMDQMFTFCDDNVYYAKVYGPNVYFLW